MTQVFVHALTRFTVQLKCGGIFTRDLRGDLYDFKRAVARAGVGSKHVKWPTLEKTVISE